MYCILMLIFFIFFVIELLVQCTYIFTGILQPPVHLNLFYLLMFVANFNSYLNVPLLYAEKRISINKRNYFPLKICYIEDLFYYVFMYMGTQSSSRCGYRTS